MLLSRLADAQRRCLGAEVVHPDDLWAAQARCLGKQGFKHLLYKHAQDDEFDDA